MTDKEKFIEKMLGFESLYIYHSNVDFSCYYWELWVRDIHMFSPRIKFKPRDLNRYRQINATYFGRMSPLFVRNPASVYRLMAKMAKHTMGMRK